MRVPDYSKRILALAELLHRWVGQLMKLDGVRREKVARYADEIASTLGRAAEAHHKLEENPGHGAAKSALVREFGRISGYLETIVGVLHRHLDGRKLAGVKKAARTASADRHGAGSSCTAPSQPASRRRRQADGRRGLLQGLGRCIEGVTERALHERT